MFFIFFELLRLSRNNHPPHFPHPHFGRVHQLLRRPSQASGSSTAGSKHSFVTCNNDELRDLRDQRGPMGPIISKKKDGKSFELLRRSLPNNANEFRAGLTTDWDQIGNITYLKFNVLTSYEHPRSAVFLKKLARTVESLRKRQGRKVRETFDETTLSRTASNNAHQR